MEHLKYNATVTGKILITPDLMVLRLRPDSPRTNFFAGQYATIGLLESEPRSANSVLPSVRIPKNTMIKRSYSIASAGNDTQQFEFYISQVKGGNLTPRLFNLTPGKRMWIDENIPGYFKLAETPVDCNIVMIATGTGLSPFISFLRTDLQKFKNNKMAIFHGAAQPWDLGYHSELHMLENIFPNIHYLPTLLKADDYWTGLRGYIERHLMNNVLEDKCGIELDPKKTHFYLCGNPKMIDSMITFLSTKGFKKHTQAEPGQIHVEEY
ncbi:MAG: ferredoxin--NADP reductase [Candidatus Kapabacteria bacterium]|nr:ferredoxin--NADP reductase [Candidatus Kapabacteria bacterium]